MERFKQILDIHPNPCVIHIDFVPKYANDAFAVFSGMETAQDVLGLETIRVLFEEAHWPEAQRRYREVIETGIPTPPKIINHTDVKGNPMIAEITDKVVEWDGEKALCTFISVVTDKVERERALMDLAVRDDLTGLYNRRYLVEQFDRGDPQQTELRHLAMVDIDHFKKINDTYGHPVGDQVLCQVANLINSSVAPGEYVSRLGGEEFALILHSSSTKTVLKRLNTLREQIASHSVKVSCSKRQPVSLSCSVSIGVTPLNPGEGFVPVNERADKALYRAKREGRNLVRLSHRKRHSKN